MIYVTAKLLEAKGDPNSRSYFDTVESLSQGYAFYHTPALEISFVLSQLKKSAK